MELSGNLTQYESGSAAGWSTVAVLQTFPCTSLTKTGCPGSNSVVPVEVAVGCLLSNSLANPGGIHIMPYTGWNLRKV